MLLGGSSLLTPDPVARIMGAGEGMECGGGRPYLLMEGRDKDESRAWPEPEEKGRKKQSQCGSRPALHLLPDFWLPHDALGVSQDTFIFSGSWEGEKSHNKTDPHLCQANKTCFTAKSYSSKDSYN
jgi:hypothetical protein